MAIYHFHVKVISRGKGRNIIAAAAYRRAVKMYDEREGRAFNYEAKSGVIYSELSIPDHAPAWLQNVIEADANNNSTETFWNLVDKTEKRIDARLAREIEFALPLELTQEQNRQLAKEFIQDEFVQRGMIADWSIHWDAGNPHVHVLLTTRSIEQTGFGKKNRSWNDRDLIMTWRLRWSEYANYHLQLNRHDVRIDHRSYADQGIELTPGIHQGRAVIEMQERGISTERFVKAESIKKENLKKIANTPYVLLNKLAIEKQTFTEFDFVQEGFRYCNSAQNLPLKWHQIRTILDRLEKNNSVFSDQLLAKELFTEIQAADTFVAALAQIKQTPELIHLGLGEDGRYHYTTQKFFTIENNIQAYAESLALCAHLKLSHTQFLDQLKNFETGHQKALRPEQKEALKHLLTPVSISCLVGIAGSGKSFLLNAARTIWEDQGVRVHGIALAGIAAKGLEQGAGIQSNTIASFLLSLESNPNLIRKNDVIVMDEAGMCDACSMENILAHVHRQKAKLVLVGDPSQLQPVGPGAPFRAILERTGYAKLETVYRQEEAWQKEATFAFSVGKTYEALSLYEKKGCLFFAANADESKARLVQDWSQARQQSKNSSLSHYLVMAYQNKDVQALNMLLRTMLLAQRELGCEFPIETNTLKMSIAVNERLLFLENSSTLGISNGQFATITHIKFNEAGRVIQFEVKVDGSEQIKCIDPTKYSHFTYGYCTTIHKTQGATVDHTFVYADGKGWNRLLTYVAMTRHRLSCALYANKSTYTTLDVCKKALGRHAIKDSVLDYPHHFAKRRGIDSSTSSLSIKRHLANRLEQLITVVETSAYPEKVAKKQKQEREHRDLLQRRHDAVLVAEYVDCRTAAALAWRPLQEKMDALLLEKSSKIFELVQHTAPYQTWLAAVKTRNEKAALINQDIGKYFVALDVHNVDQSLLEAHAKEHLASVLVNQYHRYLSKDQCVLRDRLAFTLAGNIKMYYRFLKEKNITPAMIKAQARAHLARRFVSTCERVERNAFRIVRDYHALNAKIKVTYARLFQNESTHPEELYRRAHLSTLKQEESQRNKLAKDILLNLTSCEKALDFYKIGNIRGPHSLEDKKYAAKSWYALQSHAAYFDRTQDVARYIHLFKQGKLCQERLQLAHQMIEQPRFYAPELGASLSPTLKALCWQTMKLDAKRYQALRVREQLSGEERLAFERVHRYQQFKAASSAAWKEVFSYKETKEMKENASEKLQPYAQKFTKERNQVAAEMVKDFERHKPFLATFKIPKDELETKAYAYHCRQQVERYLQSSSRLERSSLAIQIIADPKHHHPAILENALSWKALYKDSQLVLQQQFYRALSPEEKELHRLARRYKEQNRRLGHHFSRLKKANKAPTVTTSHYFNKRNYLGWRFVKAVEKSTHTLAGYCEHFRIDEIKLRQQQAQFEANIKEVRPYQMAYETVIEHVDKLLLVSPPLNQRQALLEKVLVSIEEIGQAHHLISKKKERLNYALQTRGISLEKQGVLLSKIKEHTKQLAILMGLEDSVKIAQEIKQKMPTSRSESRAYSKVDLVEMRNQLNNQAEEVAKHYLGEPKHRSNHLLRYGSRKGSLVINTRGQKQGSWRDFQTGEGGDMLSLIHHSLGKPSFRETLHEAVKFLGGVSLELPPVVAVKKQQPGDEKAHKRERARQIYASSQRIEGTLAEKYLRESRGIKGNLPDVLRFHPKLKHWVSGECHPALVVATKNQSGEVMGIQAIFLDKRTGKKISTGEGKLSLGTIQEGSLLHEGKDQTRIAIAEGLETALSILEAQPDWSVAVTFGVTNLGKCRYLKNYKEVLICADNDGVNSATQKSVEKTIQALAKDGLNVYVAMPMKPESITTWDFNDQLVHAGVDEVSKNLGKATLFKKAITQESLLTDLKNWMLEEYKQRQNAISFTLEGDKNHLATPFNLEEALGTFVQMEIEQQETIIFKHSVTDLIQRKTLGDRIMLQSKTLNDFSQKLLQETAVVLEMQKINATHCKNLMQVGGLNLISQRIKQGKMTSEDKNAVLLSVRQRADAYQQSLIQKQKQGRSQ